MLLDPNSARFPRNRQEVENHIQQSIPASEPITRGGTDEISSANDPEKELAAYWAANKDEIYNDKQLELSNEFKIKALVEENLL